MKKQILLWVLFPIMLIIFCILMLFPSFRNFPTNAMLVAKRIE